jgi:hypothetical protein
LHAVRAPPATAELSPLPDDALLRMLDEFANLDWAGVASSRRPLESVEHIPHACYYKALPCRSISSIAMSHPLNRVSLVSLELFVAAAASGTQAEAARAKGISEGGLSLGIDRLEKALSVKLFVKQGRNVVLTTQGQHLAARISPLINSLRKELDEFALEQAR